MIETARRWLEFGVDGFRCDYAQGPSHAFWSAFRAATRRTSQDSDHARRDRETPALQRTFRGRMDGWMDFLLIQTLRSFFAFGDITVSDFDAFCDATFPSSMATRAAVVPRQPRYEPVPVDRPGTMSGGFVWRPSASSPCRTRRSSITAPRSACRRRQDVRYADGSGHPEELRPPTLGGAEQENSRPARLLSPPDPLTFGGTYSGPLARRATTVELDDSTGLFVYRCSNGGSEAIVALNTGSEAVRVATEAFRGCPSSSHGRRGPVRTATSSHYPRRRAPSSWSATIGALEPPG